MATVRRHSSQEQIPIEQAQLIDPNSFAFDTSSAEALGIAGDVFEKLGKHKIEMQDRLSVSNINAAMENAQRDYQAEIIGAPLEKHAEILHKHRNNAISFANQQKLTPETRSLVDSKLQAWADFFADTGELSTIKSLERDTIIQVTTDFEKAITEGLLEDIAEAETALDEQYKISYTPAEAKVLKEKVIMRGQYNFGINSLEADPEEFLREINDKEFLPELDAQARSELKRRARTQMGIELAQQRQAKETLINAEQGRLMDIAREGKLTNSIIRGSKLDEFGLGSKDTFYKMLDAQADAALKEKELPYLKSDPTVKAAVFQMLRDPELNVTEKDISGLVGKGLSIDDAARIIDDLDVYKGFWFRRADSYLKSQLGWSDALTRFAHPEGGLSYSLAINDLFDALETEKLKDRDILDKAMEISIPHLVEYWENVLMFKGDQLERLRKKLGVKPESAESGLDVEKQIAELRKSLKGKTLKEQYEIYQQIDKLSKGEPKRKRGRPKKETPKNEIDPLGIFE